MLRTTTAIWLNDLIFALADLRALLACFAIEDDALKARIDTALAEASELQQKEWPC